MKNAFHFMFKAHFVLNPLSTNPTKWSKILQFVGNLPTNCLSVFDHIVGLALKGLRYFGQQTIAIRIIGKYLIWSVKIIQHEKHFSWKTIWPFALLWSSFFRKTKEDLELVSLPHFLHFLLLSHHAKLFKETKRSLKLVFLPHFLLNFCRKTFITLCHWPNFIAWLALMLEILGNVCIAMICCPSVTSLI